MFPSQLLSIINLGLLGKISIYLKTRVKVHMKLGCTQPLGFESQVESGRLLTVVEGFSRKTGRSWIKVGGRLYKSDFHR